jgi:hypothetical protein
MAQPSEGLVFSVPVLADAQVMDRTGAKARRDRLEALAPEGRIADLATFFAEMLDLAAPELVPAADLPEALSLSISEGHPTLRPDFALRDPHGEARARSVSAGTSDAPPSVAAGAPFTLLVQDLPPGLDLDKPDASAGSWRAPPVARFERLLRHCGVSIGLMTNREVVRLVYAPQGESTGWLDFRVDWMLTSAGAPLLDAFAALLCRHRFFGVAEAESLPALLKASRSRQSDVTEALAIQVFAALEALLGGFDRADRDLVERARRDDTLYGGLLTTLLRLVFVLYAEEHALLPMDHRLYAEHLSVLGLYGRLVADRGAFPDAMDRRYGAWPRLLSLFQAIYHGVRWAPSPEDGADVPLSLPPRAGSLFHPDRFAWLEGRAEADTTSLDTTMRSAIRTPALSDGTVLEVLDRLLVIEGQRLSYKALDVEQIGAVYERLMGYRIERLTGPSVCVGQSRVWVDLSRLLAQPAGQRARWLESEAGLARAEAAKCAQAVADAEAPGAAPDLFAAAARPEVIARDRLAEKLGRNTARGEAGQLVLQPGPERRRTSSHYTPRSLSGPIVERTLEPLLAAMGPAPSAEALLSLKICDPAMGSGAFLVEACRRLADRVADAWQRDGTAERRATDPDVPDLRLHARRLVAQQCLYGVDKNPFAVELARLSLWLVTLARDLPFSFVDHALREGDSLVGLTFDQIRSFHWAPSAQLELCADLLRQTLEDTVELRQSILDSAGQTDVAAKARLLRDAEERTERVTILADALVGAFFAHEKPAAREKERVRRLELARLWLSEGDPEAGDVLKDMAATLRETLRPFHWMVEFPEIFHAERRDPLNGGKMGVAFLDAVVGNPPFMGGTQVLGAESPAYRDWLFALYPPAAGKTDLVAYFFRRAVALLGQHGTLGLIATNTIAQGDTREAALGVFLGAGHPASIRIYDATENMAWPGDAAVTVSIVHLAVGRPGQHCQTRLNGQRVNSINSMLQEGSERNAPAGLRANQGLSFIGVKIYGQGFLLTPTEAESLSESDPKNVDLIKPYLGGEEVNSSPTQSHGRYVMDFGTRGLPELDLWPELAALARERVLPERQRPIKTNDDRRLVEYWWQFFRPNPAMNAALAPLKRCLVTARVSKHLMFSWQPTDRVLNEKLYVFPTESDAFFGALHSRVHEPWVWLLSSTMKTDLNYSASDCFETFPLPPLDAPDLAETGRALDACRAPLLVARNIGLTTLYNKLKDPRVVDLEIAAVRRLHEAMDRAVLRAYGWDDLCDTLPTFDDRDSPKARAFSDAVIDRLYALNAVRAAEEAAAAKLQAPPAKAARKPKKPVPNDPGGQTGFGF